MTAVDYSKLESAITSFDNVKTSLDKLSSIIDSGLVQTDIGDYEGALKNKIQNVQNLISKLDLSNNLVQLKNYENNIKESM